ncbi:DgyrCDS10443 [Dimorphilus gyrociliatus]|uniref:DgyrCDS10443 n=1 Tax=Dimorphilus gyrociliatus TaxID=2664684 RepID=A0A7I8W075_9ANNE|nr:DgyrCDS10443 [Dimorphilus gyrociliatus]
MEEKRDIVQYEQPQMHLAFEEDEDVTSDMILSGAAGTSFVPPKSRRPRRARTPPLKEMEPLFDKVPNYLRILSKPTERLMIEAKIPVIEDNDVLLVQRDPSPEPMDLHNKLPAYHSDFTNSTKFDECDFDDPISLLSSRSSSPDPGSANISLVDSSFEQCNDNNPLSQSSSSSIHSISRSSSLQVETDSNRQPVNEERKKKKLDQIRERRIVYVGRLPRTFTKKDLRKNFEQFGKIERCSIHIRECGDNYGFVIFFSREAAFNAVEKASSCEGMEKFDICFGGRRQFCTAEYADLDGNKKEEEEMTKVNSTYRHTLNTNSEFDALLQTALSRAKKKK